MKHIKNFRMFEAVDNDDNFIIDAETDMREFDAELERALDARYDYGSMHTFQDIVSYIVSNSLIALGKSEDEAYKICEDFEGFFDSNERSVENEYADYGRTVEGTNTYKGRVVCEYEAGGDGYGFSASVKDVTELFEDIRELLFGEVNESDSWLKRNPTHGEKAELEEKKALQKKLKELERSKSTRENAWKKSNYPSPSAHATKYKSDIKKIDLEIKDLKSKIGKIK